MKFGVFIAPNHTPGQNPALALQDDLEFIQHLDRLGFDEAWIGEHHSGGWEIVSSPEVFIATAAERTRRIRLGTGVLSLPYHHPLILADRMVLLDHLTGGRVMLGVGPGALVTDARMMGLDPNCLRLRLEEGLEAVVRLLTTDEPVTMKTDWFELHEARLQIAPVQRPCFEIAVASVRSPAGPLLAGRHGLGLLSIAAGESGFDFLGESWRLVQERAARHGHLVDRSRWRLVTTIHVARSVEQAREETRPGLREYYKYVATGPFRLAHPEPWNLPHETLVDGMNAGGTAAIGTPEMAIAAIRKLQAQSGGFGTLLLGSHDWADRDAKFRSFELFAREVMPEFQGSASRTRAAWDEHWRSRERDAAEFRAAQDVIIERHRAEQAGKGGGGWTT
ncbi:MAG: LLM class flavin-dependent oxidoreductase [Gammaproteobacteria bacterium]